MCSITFTCIIPLNPLKYWDNQKYTNKLEASNWDLLECNTLRCDRKLSPQRGCYWSKQSLTRTLSEVGPGSSHDACLWFLLKPKRSQGSQHWNQEDTPPTVSNSLSSLKQSSWSVVHATRPPFHFNKWGLALPFSCYEINKDFPCLSVAMK